MIILKSVTMMLGELDYDRTFLESHQDQHFHNLSLIILLIFAIIMPILLMNLLVGLAIGDLMQIQQNARLKRLATQVRLFKREIFRFPIEDFCPSVGSIAYQSRKEITTFVNSTLDEN